MKELFNLGELYVSDFLGENDEPRGGKVEMKMSNFTSLTFRLDFTRKVFHLCCRSIPFHFV